MKHITKIYGECVFTGILLSDWVPGQRALLCFTMQCRCQNKHAAACGVLYHLTFSFFHLNRLVQQQWLLELCYSLQTVMLTSYQRFTTVLISVSVECVTGIKRIHTTGEGQFSFSCALYPSCFLALLAGVQESHVIIFIDSYHRQTPCKQIGMLPMWTHTHTIVKQQVSKAAATHYTGI